MSELPSNPSRCAPLACKLALILPNGEVKWVVDRRAEAERIQWEMEESDRIIQQKVREIMIQRQREKQLAKLEKQLVKLKK